MASVPPGSSSSTTSSTRRHPHLALPLSLRRGSAQRKASTPHLSVVFADPSLSHGGAAPSRPGTLASEDALARQMNAGGQEIGLRSRRSSSATVRTMRTISGVGSPGVDEQPEAGPSTPRKEVAESIKELPDDAEENVVETARRLNPKQSSSWLRWNTPSGFPRSRTSSMAGGDKGKGKERDLGEAPEMAAAAEPISGVLLQNGPSSVPDVPSLPPPPAPDVPLEDHPAPDPPIVEPASEPSISSPAPTIRPAARTYRRNWWSRTASPAPSIRRGLPPEAKETVAEEEPAAQLAIPLPNPPPEASPAAPPASSPSSGVETSAAGRGDATAPPAASSKLLVPPTAPTAPVSGWRSYIWGNPAASPLPPGDFVSSDNTLPLVAKSSSPEAILPTPVEAGASPGAPTDVPSVPLPTAPDPPPPGPVESAPPSPERLTPSAPAPTPPQGLGWGSFLFTLVAPQLAVARSLESASALANQPGAYPAEAISDTVKDITVNPAEDQRPEPTSKQPISGLPNPPNTTSPLSTHSDTLSPPSDIPEPGPYPSPALRKASTSSTAGWLSYLAYRSTQKKITDGSVRSGTTAAGRNSSEIGEEEVMDLSADPDFPNVSGVSGGKKADVGTGVAPATAGTSDKDKMPPPKSIPNKSSSANLAVKGKRHSVSSVRSGGTLTPLSSSPKAPGLLDPKATPAVSPRPSSITSSALPPPPHVPAQQPNLVIPTFDNTFDRPPRSFLPLPPPTPEPVAESSTTSALAWKALSVAGSYVYAGASEKGKVREVAKEDEGKKETRGRKEGRTLGGDLPRRVGLGGGDPDEGWKGVKRVVVVGVHGWFPAKMLNSVIGEPTGTSVKFANMMGAAVKQFFAEQGMEEEIRLTLMPLEGEGTIDARVDKLYKAYLSNPAWINDLRRADAIFFAAHSQGCIVTTHLLSRMIAQGHIRTPTNADAVGRCEWAFGPIGVVPPDSRRRSPLSPLSPTSKTPSSLPGSEGGYQKVCMLAMCGVHLGPLYSISTSTVIQPYLQWFENAAARELFEFQESTSAVSLAYQKALGMVLENGVKVVLLASLNDQVVPIYGSSFSTAAHPLLLRALFVDGASYSQTDFMTILLCFAFMLRNAGLDDQRLIEHLSEATAGSLTGVGHSTPYEEPQSYALAVKYLFLSGPAYPAPSAATKSIPHSPSTSAIPPLHVEPFSARDPRNEFELPWTLRALVDSPDVKDLFPGELRDLREGVLAWKPVTKVLKEVKKRLEPMAGRQSRLRPIPNSPSSASVNTVGSVGSVGKEATLGGLKRDW